MTEPNKAGGQDSADPSMEEILASIRRILNEDEAPPTPEPASTPDVAVTQEPDPDEDVLVLDRSMLVSAPDTDDEAPAPVAAAEPEPAEETAAIAEPDQVSEALADPVPSTPLYAPPRPDDSALLGPEAAAAAASSVDGLLRTLAASRSTHVYRGGPTLEDLVREEIRPLLKDWLDNHLPGLVERLVRTEIERVVGRAVS